MKGIEIPLMILSLVMAASPTLADEPAWDRYVSEGATLYRQGDCVGPAGGLKHAGSFFYAGGTALAVSHWAVASDPTVTLTTGMFQAAAESPDLGKAEALRRSMLALMNDPKHPDYAHPMYWAPFILVGEGARRREKASAHRFERR